MYRKRVLFTGVAAAMLAIVKSPFAAGQESQEIPDDASRPASLGSVVLTAQKVEQNFLDVPVAANSISGEDLELAQVKEFQDLVLVSPFITFFPAGDARAVGVQIRGIGVAGPSTAVEPAVGAIVDGGMMGRTVQYLADLADIERIEVLRGPQSILFGKNTSAGLINIITKRPGSRFEGSVRASATDDGGRDAEIVLSGPLTRAIRGRIALYRRNYDGMVEDLFGDRVLNGNYSRGVRAKLEFDITDSTSLLLIVDHSEQYRDCCIRVPVDLGGNPFYEYDYAQAGIAVNDHNFAVLSSGDVFSDTKTSGITAELNVEFGRSTLTSITTLRGFELDTQEDVDALPYAGPAYGRAIVPANGASGGDDQEHVQTSQELRISTEFSTEFDMTAGLSYWNQEVDRYFERAVFYCPPQLGPDPAVTSCTGVELLQAMGHQTSVVDSVSWALFGQANHHFAENWTLSYGLRHTSDAIDSYFFRDSQPGPGVAAPLAANNSVDETNVSGRLALQWDAGDSTMMYASYSEGYRAPAFNVDFELNSADGDPIPAETSKSWEFGIRSEPFNRRLRLGATAFHTRFDDFQDQGSVQGLTGVAWTTVGGAMTKGLELELAARPSTNLSLNGGLAWVDAHYGEYRDGPCYPEQTPAQGCVGGKQELTGRTIANSPDLKVTFQVRYDIEVSLPIRPFVYVNYRWQSDSPGAANQDPRLMHESYGIVDFLLGLDGDDGHWSAQLFAKNLFDRFYEDARFARAELLNGGVDHLLARDFQRYVGARVEYRFGRR